MKVAAAPDDIVETHEEGAANDREPLLVLTPLREFLAGAGLEAPADLSAVPYGDGHSNVTYSLSTGVVLRRPPRGPLPPSAHDVLREARLLRALEGTAVRTPRVLAACEDESVIGSPFYVMEEIQGDVITATMPDALDTPQERRRVAGELVDALAEVHSVDFTSLQLEGFGKPTGYLERQLRRFLGLWDINKTREIPAVESVAEWLQSNFPQSGPATVVHGDYRLGNTMLAPQAPARLIAIFDWEMSTIGDPLADLGYLCTFWVSRDDPPAGVFERHAITRAPGFPSREELVARYEERSGRSMGDIRWYRAMALWKIIVFMEGNYRRAVSGATDDPYLKAFGEGVLELARRAEERALGG